MDGHARMSLHHIQLSPPSTRSRVVTVTPTPEIIPRYPETVALQHFSSSIDARNIADVAAALDAVLAQVPGWAIIDMTAVDFMSVSGVALLARFCEDAKHAGIVITCAANKGVSRAVALCASAIPTDELSCAALLESLDVDAPDDRVVM